MYQESLLKTTKEEYVLFAPLRRFVGFYGTLVFLLDLCFPGGIYDVPHQSLQILIAFNSKVIPETSPSKPMTVTLEWNAAGRLVVKIPIQMQLPDTVSSLVRMRITLLPHACPLAFFKIKSLLSRPKFFSLTFFQSAFSRVESYIVSVKFQWMGHFPALWTRWVIRVNKRECFYDTA